MEYELKTDLGKYTLYLVTNIIRKICVAKFGQHKHWIEKINGKNLTAYIVDVKNFSGWVGLGGGICWNKNERFKSVKC